MRCWWPLAAVLFLAACSDVTPASSAPAPTPATITLACPSGYVSEGAARRPDGTLVLACIRRDVDARLRQTATAP